MPDDSQIAVDPKLSNFLNEEVRRVSGRAGVPATTSPASPSSQVSISTPTEQENKLNRFLQQGIANLTGSQVGQNAPPVTAQGNLAPQSTAQLAATVKLSDQLKPVQLDLGQRPGVNLDIQTGAPLTVRARLGAERDLLNQIKILGKIYGIQNVDQASNGRFIIRNQPDGQGGVKDLVVDPPGLDTGDIAGAAADILPGVAGAAAAVATRGLFKGPIAKVVTAATSMALGQEVAGAGKDMIDRLLEGNPVEPTAIAKDRLKMAGEDAIFGMIMAPVAKVMSKTLSTMAGALGVSIGETATTKAASELEQQTGVHYPLTPGQKSESRLLLRGESIVAQRLGSAGAFDKVMVKQRQAEDELRRVFLGLPRTMSDEDLATALPRAEDTGQKVLSRLGAEALQQQGAVEKAKQAILKTGTAEVQTLAGVDLASPLNVTKVGQFARERAVSEFDKFKAAASSAYDTFLSNPEVQAKTVPGDALARLTRITEKDLTPSAIKPKEVKAFDAYGSPITRTKIEQERLDAFVPSKVRGFIDELKSLKGAKVSVNDLKQIRTGIDNAIAEGVAIPGTDIKQLVSLKENVNTAIEGALSGMSDKTLLSQWKMLNEGYRQGISRFNRSAIRPLLIAEGEKGSVGNTQIAESIMGNEPGALDRYNDFKDFFGTGSVEFKALQQATRQQILRGALGETTGYIDGAVLRSRLRSTRDEILGELLGTNAQELHRIGEVLSVAQGKLDVEELNKLVTSRSLTATKVADLIKAEQSRAVAFNNKLIRAAASGTLDAEKIKPSEVVRHIGEMDPADAARVMGILSDRPDVVQEIRQLTVENLLERSQAGLPGKERLAATALRKAFGDDTHRRTLEVVLGKKTSDGLESLAKTLTSKEVSATEFKGGGRLAGSMDVTRLAFSPSTSELKKLAVRFVMGTIYTGPGKTIVGNLMTGQDQGRFLNGVIASTPFIQSVLSRFGPEAGRGVMAALGDIVSAVQEEEKQFEARNKPVQN